MAIKVHEFYRSNNLRVLEIKVGHKCPLVKDWPHSTKSADEVDKALTSPSHGYNKYGWLLDDTHVVVDIDTHDPSENGWDALARLSAAIGFDVRSRCGAIVTSPSGGAHLYFSKPVDCKFGKVFKQHYAGIDFISGLGKQVIAAGSHHDKYPGVYTLTGDKLLPIPMELVDHLNSLRSSHHIETTSTVSFPSKERSGDEFNKSERGLRLLMAELQARGYTVRRRADYYEFDRPGKTTDSSCSGHVGKLSEQGNYQLTCFSLSDAMFPSGQSMAIFHAYALLTTGGDHQRAAMALYDRGFAEVNYGVDLSEFNLNPQPKVQSTVEYDDDDSLDDESFAQSMVPTEGLLRMIYDYYCDRAQRLSHVIGLATAVSLCETIMGRRIASHTDLRTNDYNVVLAPTTCGKEAAEETISSILEAVPTKHTMMLPPDIQSGNGLMKALSQARCGIWVSDEFGMVLKEVLNEKQRSSHMRDIGKFLLKLYGKSASTYGGASHADGSRNKIIQPHLCVLGLTTSSTLFSGVTADNVSDGLFGRIAWWPVQNRPPLRKMRKTSPSPDLVEWVDQWVRFVPSGNLGAEFPDPAILEMYPAAEERWESHRQAIDERMNSERETRAAVWGRVAARSMKLALVHRAARLTSEPTRVNWKQELIETEDVEWGIKLSNWLARISCDLIQQNIPDRQASKAAMLLLSAIQAAGGQISQKALVRKNRSITAGEFIAAAGEVGVEVVKESTKGKKATVFRKTATAVT